ncbi:bifunctional hydroxymethylpyrimidine kinase/phosphomethylpyrimidine kinase [Vulcanisaeta thermophila]|uniref:bifunctional hydroxymethylpyrimidine kinase/phosphomethylpyrimidine kinase n=1 Tax=Vulcanisaeta thermophila TaxID=867917 RepID=UPI00085374A2|nr:bifunctional hydroxymethylpyrimidine kinase/phosphomethylpyrimidine kinase [Vulcanisaeta thermophila]
MGSAIPRALTIAGLDSGGGAGITADLKTFHALGVYGMVALTAVTAQNTLGVRAVQEIDPSIVEAQINAVAEDIGVDAAKTGMLSSSPIMEAVARTVRKWGFPLVVDPVMYAKSGDPLIRPEAMETLKRVVIPIAKVITPNAPEASHLAGFRVETLDDARRAAKVIAEELHPEVVIVKGGHLTGSESIDIVYFRDTGEYRELRAPRIETKNTHGTGCSFSAAIAAGLAKGLSTWDAIKLAKELITTAIRYSLPLGHGHGPVNPMAWLEQRAYRYDVIEELNKALKIIEDNAALLGPYIPEVQSNIGYALPGLYARDVNDVAAVPGRIVRYMGMAKPSGPPTFGASSHVARYILTAMKYDESIRSAMNIKYDEKLIEKAKSVGFVVSSYDRTKEPEDVKSREGASIPWGTEQAIKAVGRVPDIIYHRGDWGKEPEIIVLGRDPIDVVNKVLRLLRD